MTQGGLGGRVVMPSEMPGPSGTVRASDPAQAEHSAAQNSAVFAKARWSCMTQL
jgi:hypothetical protein